MTDATQRPLGTVWEQLERIEATLAHHTALLLRLANQINLLAGKPTRDTDQTSMTGGGRSAIGHLSPAELDEQMIRATGAMRVPGGHRDPD